MALDKTNLTVLAQANGFKLCHYRTNDAAATVDTSGYFNDVASILNVGDFILAHTSASGTPVYGLFVTTANSGGVVDVADINTFGGTDTD